MTHICVGKLTIIGSDNVLSPGRRQAIIQTNDGVLLIEPLGTNVSEMWSEIHTFSFKEMHLKLSSAKWRPLWLGLYMLMWYNIIQIANLMETNCISRWTEAFPATITINLWLTTRSIKAIENNLSTLNVWQLNCCHLITVGKSRFVLSVHVCK